MLPSLLFTAEFACSIPMVFKMRAATAMPKFLADIALTRFASNDPYETYHSATSMKIANTLAQNYHGHPKMIASLQEVNRFEETTSVLFFLATLRHHMRGRRENKD